MLCNIGRMDTGRLVMSTTKYRVALKTTDGTWQVISGINAKIVHRLPLGQRDLSPLLRLKRLKRNL
jgi:hypothetical protein